MHRQGDEGQDFLVLRSEEIRGTEDKKILSVSEDMLSGLCPDIGSCLTVADSPSLLMLDQPPSNGLSSPMT